MAIRVTGEADVCKSVPPRGKMGRAEDKAMIFEGGRNLGGKVHNITVVKEKTGNCGRIIRGR